MQEKKMKLIKVAILITVIFFIMVYNIVYSLIEEIKNASRK